MTRGLAIAFLAMIAAGCAHDPIDPTSADARGYETTSHRADHEPWGTVAVRDVSDRRPAFELGESHYLEASYTSEAVFRRSVPATLKGLVVRELVTSGAFTPAADATAADYVVDIRIVHLFARSDRDVIGLIPVIPSIDIDCEIDLELRLVDQDGRRFLEKRYEKRGDALAATITGVQATSARLLYRTLAEVMDAFVRDADRAIPEFWSALGLPMP